MQTIKKKKIKLNDACKKNEANNDINSLNNRKNDLKKNNLVC